MPPTAELEAPAELGDAPDIGHRFVPDFLATVRARKPGFLKLYDDSHKAAILAGLESGHTILEVCSRKGMPSVDTVYRMEEEDSLFASALSRAQASGGRGFAARSLAVLQEEPPTIGKEDRVDSGWVQWKKNLSDRLAWFAKCFDRATYGDQVAVEHSGGVTLTAAGVRERLSGDSEVQKLIAGRVVPQKPTE